MKKDKRRTIKFTVEVDVFDEKLLRRKAIEMREEMWRDGKEWAEAEKPDIGDLLFEALLASSSVEFDLIGVEIGNHQWTEVD